MNKKYLRRAAIIAASCLVLMSALFIVRELIVNKQVVDSTINDTLHQKKQYQIGKMNTTEKH